MNTNFEDNAKKKLSQHHVDVNAEELWKDIYPQVRQKKKDRRFFWLFFIGGAAFLVMSILGYQYLVVSSNENILLEEASNGENTQPIQEKNIDQENVHVENINSDYVGKSNDFVKIDEMKNQSNSNDLKGLKESKQNYLPKNEQQEKIQKVEQYRQVDADIVNYSNNSIVIGEGGIFKQQQYATTNIFTTKATATQKEFNQKIKMPQMSLQEVEELQNSTVSENEVLILQQKMTNGFLFNNLPTLEVKLLGKDDLIDFEGKLPFEKQAAVSSKTKKSSKFGFGFYSGLGGTFNQFEATEVEYVEYLDKRKRNTKQLESLHFGFEGVYKISNHWSIKSGVEYSLSTSVYENTNQLITYDTIPDVIVTIYKNTDGETVYEEMGMATRTHTTDLYNKRYSSFHKLDVPISLAYTFKRYLVSFDMEAGIFANILLKGKGEILSFDNTFYDLNSDVNSWYKTNLGITPYLALATNYELPAGWQLRVAPIFRFNKIYTTSNSPVAETKSNLGVYLGLRYFLK